MWRAVVSAALALVMVLLLHQWESSGDRPRLALRGLLLLAAVPTAWFFAQLAVLTTGVPFVTLAKRWDSLSGLQRFALGLAIIAIVVVVIGCIGLAVVT